MTVHTPLFFRLKYVVLGHSAPPSYRENMKTINFSDFILFFHCKFDVCVACDVRLVYCGVI